MKKLNLFFAIILSSILAGHEAHTQRLGIFSYDNTYGQLGNGTFNAPTSTTTIYQVGSDTNWVAGACGADHNLAIKTDRTLWAWGRNHKGQLGDGTLVNKNVPTQVGTATNWKQFDGGGAFSMAIKTDGTLWGWGDNSQGQLGDSTTIDKITPVQIGTANDWLAVTCGNEFVLALKTDSTLWAWGDNAYGQLGDGTTTDKLTPVQIGADKWIQIAAGFEISIGMKSDSLPYKWGNGATTITVFYNDKVMKIDATAAGRTVWAIKTDSILSCFGSPTSIMGGSGNATPNDFTNDTIKNADMMMVICKPGEYYNTAQRRCLPCPNEPRWLQGTLLKDIAIRNTAEQDFVSISGVNTVKGGSVTLCDGPTLQYQLQITTSLVWSRIDGGATQALVAQAGCTNPVAGGTIGTDQSINYNTVPATLTNVTAPTGQSGLLEYKWQSSGNGTTFTDIPLSNAADFSPGALTATTWYRRLAWVDCMANWAGAAISDTVTITVGPAVVTPIVTTQAASSITTTSATGNGNITATNGFNPTNRGIIYYPYTNTDKIIGDATVTNVSENGSPDFGTGAFTTSLTGLSVNTQYNAKAHATNTQGTGYGARVAFWTLANVPAAPTVNNPTATTLDVAVNGNGNPDYTKFSIHETFTDKFVQSDGTLDPTPAWQTAATWGTKTVTGLITGTEYTFEVKARNGENIETAYGPTASSTPVAAPVVTTQAASAITAISATGNGNITAVNGINPSVRGIIYWQYNNTDQVIGDANVTNVPENGSPDFTTGTFTRSLTTLSVNTRYNARAYATNTIGTGYGSRIDFWTLANVPSAPTVNNPTATTLDVAVNGNGNPVYTKFSIHETSTDKFVQADGTLDPTAVWQTAATWGTKTVTGLNTGDTYTFEVNARNGDETETAYGATNSGTPVAVPSVEFPFSTGWAETGPLPLYNKNWQTASISSDGSKMLTSVSGGRLYKSTDFSNTWSETGPTPFGGKDWFSAAVSSDGTKMAACVYGGRLYISSDGGTTWSETGPAPLADQSWGSVSVSSNGSKMLAGIDDGRLYVSSDGGTGWTETQPAGANNRSWRSSAISSDGSIMLAGAMFRRLYKSANGGSTWTETGPTPLSNKGWSSLSITSDGSKMLAGVYGGRLYMSINAGTTWSETGPTPWGDKIWTSATMSSDGNTMLAGIENGRLYMSTDGGTTWMETQPAGDANKNWQALGISSDGSKMLAGVSGSSLYKSVSQLLKVTDITSTTATGNGKIANLNGGANATNRGVIYYPYTGTYKVIGDAGVINVSENGDFSTGDFTASLSGLSVNTHYNLRAHATNPVGTGYSDTTDFWTRANVPLPPFAGNSTATTLDVAIHANGNPAATLFAIEDSSASSSYLTATGDHSASPVWQTAASWDTVTVSGLTPGVTYYFRVKARNGNHVETAFGLSVSGNTCANPTNGGTIAADQVGCNPFDPGKISSISLPSGEVGTLEYQWQSGTTSESTGFQDVSGATDTIYNPGALTTTTWFRRMAKVTCLATWKASNAVKITVNPSPSANAGSDRGICPDASTMIGAAAITGNTYSWISVPAGFTSNASNPTVSPAITTLYTVTETVTSTGCTKSNSVTVAINPLPAAVAGANRTICSQTSTTLGAAAVPGSTYSWTSDPAGFTSTLANPTVIPAVNTTYTVTETVTATGCSNSNSVTVLLQPIPAAVAGPDRDLCLGSSTTLGAGYVPGSTYSWTSMPLTMTSTMANPSVAPLVTTVYTVVETNGASQCTNSHSVTVTVYPPRQVSVSIAADTTAVCVGSSVTLAATPVNGGANPGYQWKINNEPVTGATNSTYSFYPTLPETEVNCVLTTVPVPCTTGSPAVSNTVEITLYEVCPVTTVNGVVGTGEIHCYDATQTIIVAGGGTTFTVASDAQVTMIAGQNILYLPGTTVAPGGYMLGKIAPNGPWCGQQPTTMVTVTGQEEEPDLADQTTFKLWPNPTSGKFTIQQSAGVQVPFYRVSVYGLHGENVLSGEFPGGQPQDGSIAGFPSGLYFVRVVAGDKVLTFKLVKTN